MGKNWMMKSCVTDSLTPKTKKRWKQTGNYYYGARYYDPKTSIWLSVDPLAEQMPSWNSYNYTFSNPVRFNVPTGMAPEIVDDWIRKKGSNGKWVWNENITSKKQANDLGLDYGGATKSEVRKNWGRNMTEGVEGWWNSTFRDDGVLFDDDSYASAKVSPKIELALSRKRDATLLRIQNPYDESLDNNFESIDFNFPDFNRVKGFYGTDSDIQFNSSFSINGRKIDYQGILTVRNENMNSVHGIEFVGHTVLGIGHSDPNFKNSIFFNGPATGVLIINVNKESFNFLQDFIYGK
ncbi:RHS repeat domain-containing protein [Bizionia sp. KMM 8389]